MSTKRKYAVKVTRETTTGRITVHPVMEVPPEREGYRYYIHPAWHLAEGLVVCGTREAAERVYAMEKEVQRLGELPPEERRAIILNRRTRIKEVLGEFSWPVVLRLAGMKKDVIDSYIIGRLAPVPRRVARIKYTADALLEFAETIEAKLPSADDIAGAPKRNKRGNPDLPFIRKWHRAKRPVDK